MRSIMIGNQKISCTVRRSRKARRACLRLDPGVLEIIVPAGMPDNDILHFVRSNQRWLGNAYQRQMQQLDRQVRGHSWNAGAASGQIAYLGRMWECEVQYVPAGAKTGLQEHDDKLVLLSSPESKPDRPLSLFKKALITRFGELVAECVREQSGRYQLYPRSLRIREQKTRWGSCGIHGDINLNWRLIHAPLRVIEYVVVHELCHLQQRNHSSRFWALIADHMPDYAEQRAWLRNNGSILMLPFCD